MAKLTDTQLIVLSKAAARDDGIASIPAGLNKAAAAKVATSLISRKLMREIRIGVSRVLILRRPLQASSAAHCPEDRRPRPEWPQGSARPSSYPPAS
jgi:hypothetical protein